MPEQVTCACGCGKLRPRYDSKGKECKYIQGHNQKVADTSPWSTKPVIFPRTSHSRARKLTDTSKCEWISIGNCSGPIDVAHVNGDEMNNDPSNLKPLCRSHHMLLDRGRIDPSNPVMPPFYVGSDGKRRYQKKDTAALLPLVTLSDESSVLD